MQFLPYAIHVAFSTFPLGKEDNYVTHLDGIYEQFKQGLEKYASFTDEDFAFLYKPIKYYILGQYDIVYVSLIDSYKFAQRVFDFAEKSRDCFDFNGVSTQIQTGSIINYNNAFNAKEYKDFEDELMKEVVNPIFKDGKTILEKPYIQITNVKLNNGVLIGCGAFFQEKVFSRIDEILKEEKLEFIVTNSYNWCDLTIICFSKEPQELSNAIQKIREIKIGELVDERDLKSSLYNEDFLFDYDVSEIENSHAIIDTHSYFGIEKSRFDNGNLSDELKTIVEWQVKPGHIQPFTNGLKEVSGFDIEFNFKNGKTDFFKSSQQNNVASNIKLAKATRDARVYKHIRKLKTIPFFELNQNGSSQSKVHSQINGINSSLEKLNTLKIDEVEEINQAAKQLNLSRQLRMKIRKVFHLYNNGISDSVSYSFFIDFRSFLLSFKKDIISTSEFIKSVLNEQGLKEPDFKSFLEERLRVVDLEEKYQIFLSAFEDAFQDRVLNNYNYEDINEINIDFNASIAQIITTYDSIVKLISGEVFLDKTKKLLVRKNELNTSSNYTSINYNVYHLLEPPLIFNTVVKEILNNLHQNIQERLKYTTTDKDDVIDYLKTNLDNIDLMLNINKEILLEFKEFGNNSELEILKSFDFEKYLAADIIKYLYTFNHNTELFIFWSWVYLFQNTSLYTSIGFISEEAFNRELLRIMLVVLIFESNECESHHNLIDSKVKCDNVPEIYYLWEKNYEAIKNVAVKVFEVESFQKLANFITGLYSKHFANKDMSLNTTLPDIHCSIEDGDKLNLNEPSSSYPKDSFNNLNLEAGFLLERFRHLEFVGRAIKEDFNKGNPVFNNLNDEAIGLFLTKKKSLIFSCISYATLLWYHEKMDKKINLLKRCYETGTPIEKFISVEENSGIFIDPNGDFFITKKELRNECMRFKHAVFYSLWHLGLIAKVDLFKK